MRRSIGASSLLMVLLLGGGCSSLERFKAFRHTIEIDHDTLDAAAPVTSVANPYPIDLEVDGFLGDDRRFLAAIVEALDEHPGLDVKRIAYRAGKVPLSIGRRSPAPSPTQVRISGRHVFSGDLRNAFIAFPGMIFFTPVWLGYYWQLDYTFEAELSVQGTKSSVRREVQVCFRERNCRRSALFHLWPSTGILGTQFVLGVFMAPAMCFFHTSDTLGPLLEAMKPRFGGTFAAEVFREVTKRRREGS